MTSSKKHRKEYILPRTSFSKEEITAQMEAGKEILDRIREAAADPSVSSFTIPEGDYGFSYKDYFRGGLYSAIVLEGLNRPDDNPFTINAEEATFWFSVTGKPCPNCVRSLQIKDSSNITIKGLTLDLYEPINIEGAVSKIDRANNRIAIKLFPGTLNLDENTLELAVCGTQARIIALKENGDLIASFYKIDEDWGPAAMFIKDIRPAQEEGEFWLTLKKETLLDITFEEKWANTYGKRGILEIGDSIAICYGGQFASLDNCKHITMEGIKCYITAGCFWENGGYGDHLWKDCYFGTRPGTYAVIGGDGIMSQGLRHGSTVDNVQFLSSTDDQINIHGFWSEVDQVFESSILFKYAPVGISVGDKAEFLDDEGRTLHTLTVADTPIAEYNYNGFLSTPISFTSRVPDDVKGCLVRWPSSECSGWTIKNCTFENTYQRILFNSGSGSFINNKVINMGFNFALTSMFETYEGGVIGDVEIKNNVFVNCSTHPSSAVIDMLQTEKFAPNITMGKISVTDNAFVSCGAILRARNVSELIFYDNIIVSPVIYAKETIDDFGDVLGNISGATKNIIKYNTLVLKNPSKVEKNENDIVFAAETFCNKIYKFCKGCSSSAKNIVNRCRLDISMEKEEI